MKPPYELLGSKKNLRDLTKEDIVKLEREIIEFETYMVDSWNMAEIPFPVHFSGGNERQLIDLFKKISPRKDWIFTTYRNHYHYLLAGGSPEKLEKMIREGQSMYICDESLKFYSTSIVAGHSPIAVGTAKALKLSKSQNKVWCFLGDGAEDSGTFYESVRYVDGWDLPCTFVIEDNNRSVETEKKERYGTNEMTWPSCVIRYQYKAKYPHVGTGEFVNFSGKLDGGMM